MSSLNNLDNNIESEIDSIIESSTNEMLSNTKEYNKNKETLVKQPSENNISNDQSIELDEESIQAFNISLQNYLAIDREKYALLDSIKQRNGLQKNYEQSMLCYLNQFNIKNIALEGSYKNKVIESETKTVSTGFTRSMVVEVLTEVIGSDSELFDTIMTKLQERIKQKDVQKLKLIDLAKKRITKKEKNQQNNNQVENILEGVDQVIPENMKYLYENTNS